MTDLFELYTVAQKTPDFVGIQARRLIAKYEYARYCQYMQDQTQPPRRTKMSQRTEIHCIDQLDQLDRKQLVELAEKYERWWIRKDTPQKTGTTALRKWLQSVWQPSVPPEINGPEDIEGLQRGELIAWLIDQGVEEPPPSHPTVAVRRLVCKQLEKPVVEDLEEETRIADDWGYESDAEPVEQTVAHDWDEIRATEGASERPRRAQLEAPDVEWAESIPSLQSSSMPCPHEVAVDPFENTCEAIVQLLDVYRQFRKPSIHAAITECVQELGRAC